MQNHQGTIDPSQQPKISQSDKLLFCAFLALAFHAMIFFGVGFKAISSEAEPHQKVFNVVLAQFEAQQKPEKADFIGQADQEGGGESEELLAPSVTDIAKFNDPNKVAAEAKRTASQQQAQSSSEFIAASGSSTMQAAIKDDQPVEKQLPDSAELIDKSYQLSGLIANLDNQTINQARKGRKRQVSASIHRASDALYLDSWRRKIEQVGNQNYPEKAKAEQIYGNVTMKVAINRDGTINTVKIMNSSGSKVLDRAALNIVRLAAPFNPLTQEMSRDTDILEIIRVWQFQPDYSLKAR
jgi:periplasmic protein TonB